ncbi:hypothetical protein N7481_000609 [Penicillium waksmanii]|uniref:uncharacterized protein n=1 Tax=Penicillium waksmanii TaxID=69791 RepID=UPI002547CE90|nr:uncharacterized protein N7481_000609 [Penicillium waksmanii]KAJ6000200.1 hypothetical protein N7481_000609 [Penicillium waksmanii]
MKNNHDIPNTNGDATASASKRKAPKLRPPKLRNGPTSDPETSDFNEQRMNGVTNSTKSNSPPGNSSSISTDPRQNDLLHPSPQAAPQVDENQNQRTRHRRGPRRSSTQSQDPYQDQSIEPEDRDNRSSEQRTLKERRVSHMLHPPEASGQIQGNGELVSRPAAGGVEQVSEVTEVNPQSKKNDQLKLRLDLNLDIEIELKAKIRGDVTLQLLQ